MDLERAVAIIQNEKNRLFQYGVKSLAIFGSVARGEDNEFSDIDILIQYHNPPTFDQYMETKFFLEDSLGCSVDLVIEEGLNSLVRAEVEKEAVYVA
jgi:uncharacterized protein